tara:strand:+ start:4118 stop:4336 length:219 start_codon:yes stop_codon:yes gene_type:complete
MTFILMEIKIHSEHERKIFSVKLIEECLDNKSMFANVIDPLLDSTVHGYDYCYYPNTMKCLMFWHFISYWNN